MPGIDAAHYEQDALWGEDQVFLPEHHRQRFAAIDALLPADTRTVLDVGAGDGRVLHHLSAARPDLVAVAAERSVAALAHARSLRVQAGVDSLPFADRSVDAVLCCEVLEHLPSPVFCASRAELARVADRHVLITVPNRERLRAGDVICPSCRCRFQRERHLRSFRPDDLPGLLPGWRLATFAEAGPHQPRYPRVARQALERFGVLHPPGSPMCPQCGAPYSGTRTATTAKTEHGVSRRYRMLRKLSPKARHPYWLLALYVRR